MGVGYQSKINQNQHPYSQLEETAVNKHNTRLIIAEPIRDVGGDGTIDPEA